MNQGPGANADDEFSHQDKASKGKTELGNPGEPH